MNVLILSCSTGGGHNSAGHAVEQELQRRGHRATMLDPYELKSAELAKAVGSIYVKMVQTVPGVFGEAYKLGDMVRKIPGKSPVYTVNIGMAKRMYTYIRKEGFDAVVMPHLFPAEILTYLKKHETEVPFTMFVATDYACIPFTEETDCDAYIIPNEDLRAEFQSWGIPDEKLAPLGIPVQAGFYDASERNSDRAALRAELGLEPDGNYLLISGGSMGAGDLNGLVGAFADWAKRQGEWRILVVCGSNAQLQEQLEEEYQQNPVVRCIGYTARMADYMACCDVFATKPGGLSSTEAAAVGIPIIHLSPIPGCETRNREYFSLKGMSLPLAGKEEVGKVMEQLADPSLRQSMIEAQHTYINGKAAKDICDFLERMAGDRNVSI